MKYLFVVILFLLSVPALFAQEKGLIHKGNKLYSEKKYKEAEADYRKALAKKKQDTQGNFNLGDALYKQKKFADAGTQFTKLAEAQKNKKLAAEAYHNLGNSLLESNKLQESIDAYKKALFNNPNDDQTRYNLAYAMDKLKKQKQQNKQNQNNKNQNNKNSQQNQNNNKQNNKNKNSQDKNKPDQNKQNQKNQQQQQQPDQISKQDAEQMLNALNNQEKQTLDKLKNKKFKGTKENITKDW